MLAKFRDRVRNGALERYSRCCNEWLPITEFRRAPLVKHGRLYRCKLCDAQAKRLSYAQLRAAGLSSAEATRRKTRVAA